MMAFLSQARRLHAEDLAGLRVEAHAAEALAAAAQGLDGVDPERAEDLLELVAPGMHEVGEALGAPLRVQTPRAISNGIPTWSRTACGAAPVAPRESSRYT